MSNKLHRAILIIVSIAIIPAIAFAATLRITGGTLTLPSGIVADDAVATGAAIQTSKMQHVQEAFTNFDLAIGGTPATKEQIIFVAPTAGIIHGFHWMLYDTGTSTSIAWDLKKNGTTVLSGAGSSTHSDADKLVKDGTISVTTFTTGDILSVSMTVSSATGAVGPASWADLETANPW